MWFSSQRPWWLFFTKFSFAGLNENVLFMKSRPQWNLSGISTPEFISIDLAGPLLSSCSFGQTVSTLYCSMFRKGFWTRDLNCCSYFQEFLRNVFLYSDNICLSCLYCLFDVSVNIKPELSDFPLLMCKPIWLSVPHRGTVMLHFILFI